MCRVLQRKGRSARDQSLAVVSDDHNYERGVQAAQAIAHGALAAPRSPTRPSPGAARVRRAPRRLAVLEGRGAPS